MEGRGGKVGLGAGPVGVRGEGRTTAAKPEGEDLCVEFDYVWPLNISVLQAEGPKEPIACPEFATTFNCVSYRWQLLLYLSRPLSEFGEKYMGLYLCYKSGPVDFVAIDCEMFVSALDHSRACSNLARKVELEVEGRAWGYANFCPQDLAYLERSSSAQLIGDENELKIGMTIRISVDYFKIANFFAQFHPSKEAERLSAYLFEKVCLDFEFGQERADCRILANDGAGFYANRAVLEYASPVLRTLLQKTNPFVGKDQSYNEITVDDLSSQALREILHYVYKGVPSEHLPAIAIEVVHGAHKFQLPNLKTLCEKAMVFQLNEKNAIKYLYTAETYGLPILMNMTLNMVVDRWPVIFNSKEADVLVQDKILVKKVMEACSARVNCHLNLVKTERTKTLPAEPLLGTLDAALQPPTSESFLAGTGPYGPTEPQSHGRQLPGEPLSYTDKLGERHMYSIDPSLLTRGFSPRTAEEAYAQALLNQQSQSLRRGMSQPQLHSAERAYAPERAYSPGARTRSGTRPNMKPRGSMDGIPGYGVRFEDESRQDRERRSQSLHRGQSAQALHQDYARQLDTRGLDARSLDTRSLDTRNLDTRNLDTRNLDIRTVDLRQPDDRRHGKQLPEVPMDRRNGHGQSVLGQPGQGQLGQNSAFQSAQSQLSQLTNSRGIPSSRQSDPTREPGAGVEQKRAPLLGQSGGLMSGLMSKFDKL